MILLDDTRFASCSGDKKINVYSLSSFTLISTMKGHKRSVYDICKISNTEIISCSSDQTIKIWDTLTYKCGATIDNAHDDWINKLILLSDKEFHLAQVISMCIDNKSSELRIQ